MKKLIRLLVVFEFLLVHVCAFAGEQDGPYVVWVNLSKNKNIDEVVAKHIHDEIGGRTLEENKCLPPGILVFMKIRPNNISDALVEKAVVKEDKKSIIVLNNKLRHVYNEEIDKGFDGIVVYDDVSGPRFSVLVSGKKAIMREKIPVVTDSKSIWNAFCRVVPPITRPI